MFNAEDGEIKDLTNKKIVPVEATTIYNFSFAHCSGYPVVNNLEQTNEQGDYQTVAFDLSKKNRTESIQDSKETSQSATQQVETTDNLIRQTTSDAQSETNQSKQEKPQTSSGSSSNVPWKITQAELPVPEVCDEFEQWPDGDVRYIFKDRGGGKRKHRIGWVMKNCNNHMKNVLKKSCLGILACEKECRIFGERTVYKPAVCDKARRKQLGLACMTLGCGGRIIHVTCKGNRGFPVTHAWRTYKNRLYFQAKGKHDHPRPLIKISAARRRTALKHLAKDKTSTSLSPNKVNREKIIRCLLKCDDPFCENTYTGIRIFSKSESSNSSFGYGPGCLNIKHYFSLSMGPRTNESEKDSLVSDSYLKSVENSSAAQPSTSNDTTSNNAENSLLDLKIKSKQPGSSSSGTTVPLDARDKKTLL